MVCSPLEKVYIDYIENIVYCYISLTETYVANAYNKKMNQKHV